VRGFHLSAIRDQRGRDIAKKIVSSCRGCGSTAMSRDSSPFDQDQRLEEVLRQATSTIFRALRLNRRAVTVIG
jgi:hypothetical protein